MTNIHISQDYATPISKIETTDDTLTGRAGLILFSRYIDSLSILPALERLLGNIRRNRKGQSIACIFKQLLCFIADGTSSSISYFDELQKDYGYSATIECKHGSMLSSHSVKRFLGKFTPLLNWRLRIVLRRLFAWRLRLEQPSMVVLGIDTMVMNNDDAAQREGVEPTYKKVKGFQPLQLNWKGFFVDAVFRSGKKHSNHGTDVQKMITRTVRIIRRELGEEIPIILRCDAGFLDQKLFRHFESLGIGYLCGGKHYDDIDLKACRTFSGGHSVHRKGRMEWFCCEFTDRRKSWVLDDGSPDRERRVIYCTQKADETGQLLLSFVDRNSIIYTNIGLGDKVDHYLSLAGQENMEEMLSLVGCYFDRGSDELVNRAFKDVISEKLPFKRFNMNTTWYYLSLTCFFLMESFKQDVCEGVFSASCYSTTIRRQLFDIAGKIVRTSRYVILKVTKPIMERLNLAELWERSSAPPLQFA